MHILSTFEFYLRVASIILAAVAAVLAIYLIPLTGKSRAWLLFAAALVLLAIDRVIELLGHGGMLPDPAIFEIVSEMLGIGVVGCLFGSVYFLRNIFVEHKRAEEAIRQQQELTAQIIETIPVRVFWKDRDSRFQGCNTLFAQDAGLSRPEELIGKTDFDMGWKEQAELYRADDQRVMTATSPQLLYDEPQTTPAGKLVWLRTSKVPLRDAAHQVIGILGIYEDITESKEMELRLLESEERFRSAFQNSAIGMALVGLDGRWIKVNNSLCQIVGYAEEELLDKTFQDITHPDDLQADLDFVTRLLAGEIDHYQMEKRYFHKNGHAIWVRLSVSLIRGAQDNPIHFVSQMEDVTERKLAEKEINKLNEELEYKVEERTQQLLTAQEELVRKEKLAILGQLSGSVGHELRNPLGVMSNAVYFLKMVLAGADETTQEYLEIIKKEIDTSRQIITDLLDFARTKPPQRAGITAADVVRQSLGRCPLLEQVTVTVDVPDGLPVLNVDPLQMGQVLTNLITNAVQAMPAGGTLRIAARQIMNDEFRIMRSDAKFLIHNSKFAGDFIAISVTDSGAGISPENMEKIFQPLFTTKAKGIGLGLVVCKNLVEANGGRIEVESAVGKGTTFTVELPAPKAKGSGRD
jgi:PAS domain S-box-containing protein